jgi:hypothetical protein
MLAIGLLVGIALVVPYVVHLIFTRERLSVQVDVLLAEMDKLLVDMPKTCDGKEQLAFKSWAISEQFDMEEHPLHLLFLNPRTHAAREAWRGAINYCHEQMTGSQR